MYEDLIKDPHLPVLRKDKAFPAVLTFDKHKPIAGACKFAYFGDANIPVFLNAGSNKVCIKEAFYIARQTGHQRIYDPAKQAAVLTNEINCSRWANALMVMVYQFIKEENGKRGEPPFSIP
jgi:hypothetical protein